MKKTFNKNLARLKLQFKSYIKTFRKLNVFKKALLLLIIMFLLPNPSLLLMMIIPFIMSLFIVNEELKGRKRGIFSFIISTIAQLFILSIIVFAPIDLNSEQIRLSIVTILLLSLSGALVLLPGYIIGYILHGLNYKEEDGEVYLKLSGVLVLLLIGWSSYQVLSF